jgi:hypothetical protein
MSISAEALHAETHRSTLAESLLHPGMLELGLPGVAGVTACPIRDQYQR